MTTRYTDWQAHLHAHGFTLTNMGGDIMQWRRLDGDIEELIVHRDEDTPITSADDYVQTWTSDLSEGPTPEPDAPAIPLWALLDAMDGCDCYELVNLRVANAHYADVHDADCKRFQG